MAESVKDSIDVEASAQAVFEVATDFEAYPDWNANINKVEVKETDGEGRGTKVFYEVDAKVKVVRYTLGVLSGVMPGLRVEPLWIVLSGSVGGIVTGIGVGWLANLLLRAYRPAVVRS